MTIERSQTQPLARLSVYLKTLAGSNHDCGAVEPEAPHWIIVLQNMLDSTDSEIPYLNRKLVDVEY